MWRIPTDTPQIAQSNGKTRLAEVTPNTSLDTLFHHWSEDGGVVLKGLLSPEQITQMRTELVPVLDKVQRGSLVKHPALAAFHGRNTKRAGDLVNNSSIFRNNIVENDFVHAICKRCWSAEGHGGDYWMSTATTLNAAGPQDAQLLHRDLGSYPVFAQLGPEGTESQINFLIATTKFTAANGATRIIPGSHKWPFDQRGTPEQTIAAEMDPGDVLLISGKVIHGTGANTTTEERGCIQMCVCASFLTPTEAHPFIIKQETAKKMSRRAQRFLGFRSQYPRGSTGLWTKDYLELAVHLGMEDFDGIMEDLQGVVEERRVKHGMSING